MKNLAIGFTAIGIIIGFFVLLIWLIPWGTALNTLLSVENEVAIGNTMAQNIYLQNDTLKNNTAVDSALNSITSRLLNKVENKKYNYHFKIIKSEEVNAFTIPGGNIFIYTGLIKKCDSPEELAAVIAHEIGHAEKRHVVNKIGKELGLSLAIGFFIGGDASAIINVGKDLISKAYDREQEKEADNFSLQLMDKSGIAPNAMASFFKKMDSQLSNNKVVELVMTHPADDSRIATANNYKTSNSFKAESFNLNWERVKKTLQ